MADESKLKTLTIKGTVGEIRGRAFQSLGDIDEIVIEEGVTEIGARAFGECWALRRVVIAKSVKRIEDYAFEHCSRLTEVVFAGKVEWIGHYVFEKGAVLDFSHLPYGPFSCSPISDEDLAGRRMELALRGCVKKPHGTLVVPEMINGVPVTAIDHSAFYACTQLTRLVLPRTIRSIDSGSLFECDRLSEVLLPDGLRSLNHAFAWTPGLSEVIAPSRAKADKFGDFQRCYALKRLFLFSPAFAKGVPRQTKVVAVPENRANGPTTWTGGNTIRAHVLRGGELEGALRALATLVAEHRPSSEIAAHLALMLCLQENGKLRRDPVAMHCLWGSSYGWLLFSPGIMRHFSPAFLSVLEGFDVPSIEMIVNDSRISDAVRLACIRLDARVHPERYHGGAARRFYETAPGSGLKRVADLVDAHAEPEAIARAITCGATVREGDALRLDGQSWTALVGSGYRWALFDPAVVRHFDPAFIRLWEGVEIPTFGLIVRDRTIPDDVRGACAAVELAKGPSVFPLAATEFYFDEGPVESPFGNRPESHSKLSDELVAALDEDSESLFEMHAMLGRRRLTFALVRDMVACGAWNIFGNALAKHRKTLDKMLPQVSGVLYVLGWCDADAVDKVLNQLEATPEVIAEARDAQGNNAFWYARTNRHGFSASVYERLVVAGCDPNARNALGLSAAMVWGSAEEN